MSMIAGVSAIADAAPKSEESYKAHVRVQAFADRDAVVPGEAFELAVSLKMDKEWHVYWRNPGGTGLPTSFEWTAPAGFEIGRMRFPAPFASYSKTLDETSFLHEGTSIFATTVRVPDSAPVGSKAEFKVKVAWLACRKECIPGDATVSLLLPVASKGTAPKLANEDVFKNARRALPLPTDKASYVKLTGAIDKTNLKSGDTFTATLTADIKEGHHVQSNKPAQKDLIATTVFASIEPGGGDFDIGAVVYPKAKTRDDPILGKMSEFDGKVEFKIPIEAYEDLGDKPRFIRGVFRYQACNEKGTCFPPENVAFTIPLSGAGAALSAAGDGSPDDSTIAASSTVPPTAGDDGPADDAASATGEDDGAIAAVPPATGAAPTGSDHGKSILIRVQDWLFGLGFLGVVLAGMLGGFVLNLMPCVLPVISLKVLSFVRQAHDERWRVFKLGLTYSAGIMVFYSVLAVLFYKWGTGWGELFQNTYFVIAMSAVVLAFSLSLFGVFAIFTPRVVNKLGEKTEGEGYLSAFGTGVLATVLGTACTAPFLSAAIAYAIKLGPVQGTSIFLAVGFGMALPIMVLSYNPAWLRFVPKPGPWMGTFECLMGFMLLATVIWLVNPLRVQIGDYGLFLSLIFLLAVAIAVWIKGKIEFGAPVARKTSLYSVAIVMLVIGWVLPFRVLATIPGLMAEQNERDDLMARGALAKYGRNLDWTKGIPWQHYARDLALEDVRNGFTVFVDYTATWCASCKTNLAAFIDQPDVIRVMREQNVIPYEADYTRYDPEIKKDLDRHGRAGVPMYLVFKPGDADDPEVLPEFLTQGTIIDALKRAGPSRPDIDALAETDMAAAPAKAGGHGGSE